ncbi:MAG: hypothetical protein J5614_09840 [Paludibacteraceae bacterium]|nr:hypothetical protein [Paludibacteraceae bacterium]
MNKQDDDDSKLISILKNFGPDDITHKPFYPILVEMIQTLYLLPNCESGGLGHVVIDENNIDDDAILTSIEQCRHERQRCEAPLVKCILEYMQRMTLAERAFVFYLIDEGEWSAFEFTDLAWFDLSKQKFFELLKEGRDELEETKETP